MSAVNIQRPRESSFTGDWCYNVAAVSTRRKKAGIDSKRLRSRLLTWPPKKDRVDSCTTSFVTNHKFHTCAASSLPATGLLLSYWEKGFPVFEWE